ncbi:hypothetical protein QJQ45_014362, partial [Haematococcus lacustris]
SAQASRMNQLGMPSVEELLDLVRYRTPDGYLDAYLTQLQGQPVPQDPPYSSAGPMSHTATLPQQDQLLQHQALPHPLQHASAPLVGQNFVEPRNAGLPGFADVRLPSQLNQYQFSGLSNVALPSGLQAFAQPFTGMFADQHQPASLQQQVLPMQQQHTSRSSSKTQQVANAAHAPGTGRGGRGSKGRGAAKGGRDGGSGGRRSAKGRSEPDLSSSDAEEGGSDSAGSGSGDEVKRSRKPGPLHDGERRHLALQEKNRRAQRRFRERQKNKLQDLHKQIEELTDKVSSLQGENTALHSRTNILEKVLDMRNEQIQVMQESKETAIYPAEEELGSLENVGGHLVQLTPESIKDLSSDAIYRIYQMYVKELSIRLADTDKDATASLRQPQLDLDTLVRDLSMMIMRLGVVKPLETRKFIVVSRQYLGSTEAEVINLWRNVMKLIDLSTDQKQEVVELKRLFLTKIEPIMEERKHLNIQIQANLPHDTFHTKNALTYIKAHEAVIKLRDNLKAEQHVVLEFAIAVFRGVFKSQQMAMLLVKCYPAVPDALGIASALSAELGEPESAATRQLAMQLGGYLDNGPTSHGNTFLHPTMLPQHGPHPALLPPSPSAPATAPSHPLPSSPPQGQPLSMSALLAGATQPPPRLHSPPLLAGGRDEVGRGLGPAAGVGAGVQRAGLFPWSGDQGQPHFSLSTPQAPELLGQSSQGSAAGWPSLPGAGSSGHAGLGRALGAVRAGEPVLGQAGSHGLGAAASGAWSGSAGLTPGQQAMPGAGHGRVGSGSVLSGPLPVIDPLGGAVQGAAGLNLSQHLRGTSFSDRSPSSAAIAAAMAVVQQHPAPQQAGAAGNIIEFLQQSRPQQQQQQQQQQRAPPSFSSGVGGMDAAMQGLTGGGGSGGQAGGALTHMPGQGSGGGNWVPGAGSVAGAGAGVGAGAGAGQAGPMQPLRSPSGGLLASALTQGLPLGQSQAWGGLMQPQQQLNNQPQQYRGGQQQQQHSQQQQQPQYSQAQQYGGQQQQGEFVGAYGAGQGQGYSPRLSTSFTQSSGCQVPGLPACGLPQVPQVPHPAPHYSQQQPQQQYSQQQQQQQPLYSQAQQYGGQQQHYNQPQLYGGGQQQQYSQQQQQLPGQPHAGSSTMRTAGVTTLSSGIPGMRELVNMAAQGCLAPAAATLPAAASSPQQQQQQQQQQGGRSPTGSGSSSAPSAIV